MSDILEIDGSILEGGGQILRISISLSAILGVPLRVTNIRAGRSKPGLAAQHLKGIQLVADMCQGKLKGASVGSTEVEFRPGKIKGGRYLADTHTAGSISLLLQVALPCALLADAAVTLDLKGGTNAAMAPQIDYFTEVFRYLLRKFGADFNFSLHRRGYFPKGGGYITVDVKPVRKFQAINLTERGSVEKIFGWSYVAGTLPVKLAHQMSEGAIQELQNEHTDIDIDCYKEDREYAPDNGSGIIVVAQTSGGCVLGSDALGRRELSPQRVGRAAGSGLRAQLRAAACLDQHAQDQLIIYMALGEGKSSVRVGEITLHTRTAMHIAETIAKTKFTVQELGEQNIIECTGLGFINASVQS